MGGRRSYSIKDLYGKSKKIAEDKKKIRKAIKEKKPRDIAKSSSKLVSDSKKSLDLLSEALGLLSFVIKSATAGPPVSYEERRRRAKDEWRRRKKVRGVVTTPEEDKFVLESVTRAMKRRRSK